MTAVDLVALLSACVDLGAFAGQVIRDVVASGESLQTVNKADVAATVSFDPQTIADTRAQQRIVESLRRHFGPDLTIVGEEGALDAPDDVDVTTPRTSLLTTAHPTAIPVDMVDVVVWIDPLDGTRKFTEKVYDDVSVLLGVSYRGRPIAGVMHQPFVGGGGGTTYYGGPAVQGVFKCRLALPYTAAPSYVWPTFERVSTVPPRSKTTVGHSESPCGHANAILPLLDMDAITKGSTGILLLDVALGNIDVYFRYVHRTKRWDTCVGEAFLTVLGGVVTDRHGNLYEYDAQSDHENMTGVVAALDKSMHAVVVARVATYSA